jgi:hypothetical protein
LSASGGFKTLYLTKAYDNETAFDPKQNKPNLCHRYQTQFQTPHLHLRPQEHHPEPVLQKMVHVHLDQPQTKTRSPGRFDDELEPAKAGACPPQAEQCRSRAVYPAQFSTPDTIALLPLDTAARPQ